jgi:tRNA pseudouridine38-40 synthase
MRNFKITLAYDGSEFHGWQIQPGMPTIQGALMDAAHKITDEKIVIHGASRTDAGVHALAQVASFKTNSSLSAQEFQRALNALIPQTVRIVQAEEVGQDFHARWNALGKTYRYRIFRGRVVPPFQWKYLLHYPYPLDEEAMAQVAKAFEGEHDFSSFAASSGSEQDDRERNMVKEIYRSEISRVPGTEEMVYEVRGRSFLRYMVRKVVGTLLEAGRGKFTVADVEKLFELKDRRKSGPTVPPDGLFLVGLDYPDPTASLGGRSKAVFRSE